MYNYIQLRENSRTHILNHKMKNSHNRPINKKLKSQFSSTTLPLKLALCFPVPFLI